MMAADSEMSARPEEAAKPGVHAPAIGMGGAGLAALTRMIGPHTCHQLTVIYGWSALLAMYLVAWWRGWYVLNDTYTAHVSARIPHRDAADGRVRLTYPFTRSGIFFILAAAIAASVCGAAVVCLVASAIGGALGMTANSMPRTLSMVADAVRALCNPRHLLYALDARCMRMVLVIIVAVTLMIWATASYAIPESDLRDVTSVRAFLIHTYANVPMIFGVAACVIAVSQMVNAAP